MTGRPTFDVVIAGAGPAGLSAALVLGRCRRSVLVCDTGRYRNQASHAIHGFLTRDGTHPGEFLRTGRKELSRYPMVELRQIEVVDAAAAGDGFTVILGDGATVCCRSLLLATGVADDVPDIPGLKELYGRSVFHCPYCDAWEFAGAPLAVYGPGLPGLRMALELTGWSDDLILCSDGPAHLAARHRDRLRGLDIDLCEEPVLRLEGSEGLLQRVVFAGGAERSVSALFFNTGQRQASGLAEKLGCAFTKRGAVRTTEYEATNIPGLYVAGDASRRVQLAIVAAAEGAQAAFAINIALLEKDLHQRLPDTPGRAG